uniref:Uncharacterized protein n=1 Tax=Rhizophora mucronata TaxID=61149 RepID=A0A2P2M0S8_RHIMU
MSQNREKKIPIRNYGAKFSTFCFALSGFNVAFRVSTVLVLYRLFNVHAFVR